MVHWRSFGHDFKTHCLKPSQVATGQLLFATNLKPLKLYVAQSVAKQLSRKLSTMWNRSDLVEVLCCYWQSGFFFKDFRGAAGPCLFSFLPCFQYVDNKARLGGA